MNMLIRWQVMLLLFFPGVALAGNVRITPDIPSIEVTIDGEPVVIERIQDETNHLTGYFAKTSRACPPFCLTPMVAAPGVKTIGELEVLSFIENEVTSGSGLLIDNRTPGFFNQGTLPGAVNVPFNVLVPSQNEYLAAILTALGARINPDLTWDFSAAKNLVLFCNGLWCEQSPGAIVNLVSVGYPPSKLFYYRGGVESWLSVGLNTIVPQ